MKSTYYCRAALGVFGLSACLAVQAETTCTSGMASSVIAANPPAAILMISDITPKGAILPTRGQLWFSGTPFDDGIYAPNSDSTFGLNGGFDTQWLADPAQDRPGKGEIDLMEGSTENNGGARGDLFVLGDAKKPYYTGKAQPTDAERDFVYINRFDPAYARVRLNGNPSDYSLVSAYLAPQGLPEDLLSQIVPGPLADIISLFTRFIDRVVYGSGQATAIFRKENCDLVGVLRDVPLFHMSALDGRNFEYASLPQQAPALSRGGFPVEGLAQFTAKGMATQPVGGNLATAADGSLFWVFGSSAPAVAGVTGDGSFYLAKYDAAGRQQWVKKHGTSRAAGGSEIVHGVKVNGNEVFVYGETLGAYGGPKGGASVLGNDKMYGFVARFDMNGNLLQVVRLWPGPDTSFSTVFGLSFDNAGDLYVAGGITTKLTLPANPPYISKLRRSDLSLVWNTVLKNGPPFEIVVNLLNPWKGFQDTLATVQLTNTATSLQFVPDASNVPGRGSLFVTGFTTNGRFFGANPGWNDVWYAKLNAPDGALGWGRSISATRPETDSFVTQSAIDSVGNLYLSGLTNGKFNVAGEQALGGTDSYVAKVNPSGVVQWVKHLGSSAHEAQFPSMLIDRDQIYVSGITGGSVQTGASKGGRDLFLARLDTQGNLLKQLQFGTERDDWNAGLAVSGNRVFIAGVTEGSMVGQNQGVAQPFLSAVSRSGF